MATKKDLALFKEKAEAVSAVVQEIGSLQDAFAYTVELTKTKGGGTIAAPGLNKSALNQLGKLCGEGELTLLSGDLRSHLEDVSTGFTVADFGIAESGSIVQDSSSEDIRIATMLSDYHVAVLPESQVMKNYEAIENDMAKLFGGKNPSYLAFITGPSRTADIERVLAIGVHGPLELHILLLKD